MPDGEQAQNQKDGPDTPAHLAKIHLATSRHRHSAHGSLEGQEWCASAAALLKTRTSYSSSSACQGQQYDEVRHYNRHRFNYDYTGAVYPQDPIG